MCDLCEITRNSPEYMAILSKMQEEDIIRLEATMKFTTEMQMLNNAIYSSVKWPVKLVYPMFDTRTAYSVPSNYFQNLYLNNEKQGMMFAHGAMRSLFFAGKRLMLFSKSVSHYRENDFFTSFLLIHFEPSEYEYSFAPDGTLVISADIEKPMENLITGKTDKKRVKFSFTHKSVLGRIVTKERVLSSAHFRDIYAKYGGAQLRSASMDIEGYAITVPHFAPHPYMLQLHTKFGYKSNREFQEHAIDYFKAHLKPGFEQTSSSIL